MAAGTAIVCEVVNGVVTVHSLNKTLKKLEESVDFLRDQLDRVNDEIAQCPFDDTQRLEGLFDIRNDLVEALSEAVAQNTPISMGDIGPGMIGAGLCGLLLLIPPI